MDRIDRMRAFNRFYTNRLGLLARSYLDSGLTLTEVRVLHDLAEGEAQTARGLAGTLALDEGYLSRILARFRAKGWIARRENPADRRQAFLSLTAAGQAAYVPLAERSRAEIAATLAHLSEAGQEAACQAVEQAQSLLGNEPPKVILRDLQPGDAGWLIWQHGTLYARDEGYDHTFEALVAEILADFLKNRDPSCDRGWIAEADGQRLGSIFCVRQDAETAKLRLFLLVPEARGMGLGHRMLTACMDHARACGYRRMTLWTHKSHQAACALYAAHGFRMTGEVPAQAFGQEVIDQTWEIDL